MSDQAKARAKAAPAAPDDPDETAGEGQTAPPEADPSIDEMTAANVLAVGEAPAMAMALLYQSAAMALGTVYQQMAAQAVQQGMVAQAVTLQGVTQLYNSGGETTSAATKKLSALDLTDTVATLQSALRMGQASS